MMVGLDLYKIFKNTNSPVNKYNPKYNSYHYSSKNIPNTKLVSSMNNGFISFSDKYNDMCVTNNIRKKIKKLCIENGSIKKDENNNEQDSVTMAIVKQSKVNAVICVVSLLLVKYFFPHSFFNVCKFLFYL
jgi:hypothetical protein